MKSFIFHLESVLLVIVCTAPRLSLQMGGDPMPFSVRLVEPWQPNSGRVQVQINDSAWLDVCENGWDEEDGRVVCRQLGFQGLTERLRDLPIDGQRSTESVNYFRCQGSESSLLECEHQIDRVCGLRDGAGVVCSAFPTTEAPTEMTTAERTTRGATSQEPDRITPSIIGITDTDEMGGTTTREDGHNSELMTSPNEKYGTTTRPTAGDGVLLLNGAYIGLALGCALLVVCAGVIVMCLLKRHKRSADNYNKEDSAVYENSQGSNHLVLGELGNSHAGQAAPKSADDSAEYAYCAVEGKGIPVDAGYVNAPTPALVKTRQAEKAVPKSVDNSAEYAYCAVEGREYSEVDAGHPNAPTQAPVKSRQAKQAAPKSVDTSAEYAYCAVEGKGIPVDAGYANAPTSAMAKTRQAQKAAPKSVDTSAEYAYCAVEGKGILEGSVDAEAGYLLPNPAPIKTSVNI